MWDCPEVLFIAGKHLTGSINTIYNIVCVYCKMKKISCIKKNIFMITSYGKFFEIKRKTRESNFLD